ncbi:cation efflux family-domain-containing protein [Xylaria cubensis]|nr:cation efflux family-domain-containing protein [Xylaria cubensis]
MASSQNTAQDIKTISQAGKAAASQVDEPAAGTASHQTKKIEDSHVNPEKSGSPAQGDTGSDPADPLDLGRHRRSDVTSHQLKSDYPNGNHRKLKRFYTQQNELIDHFLGAEDEERLQVEEDARMAPRIKFAVNASFAVNFGLFVIQVYAAASTGSLSLFATAADAFVDLVSSFIIWITSRLAAKPSVYKYPVGRTRIETIGIILFCSLLTTVAVELLVSSKCADGPNKLHLKSSHVSLFGCIDRVDKNSYGRRPGFGASSDHTPLVCGYSECVHMREDLGDDADGPCPVVAKSSLMLYCFFYRRYPSVHVFFIDHRNDIVVNSFGLTLSIIGNRVAWFVDPIGAIIIALLILFSWVSNAFEQVWLLVGKSAPRDFISKLIYLAMTHDSRILKVDTCRAYHSGQRYYVEVDIIMDIDTPLKISHDVSQSLQRKFEGLGNVERAFVHVDYDDDHDIYEEHKKLYKVESGGSQTLRSIVTSLRPC